MSRPSAALPESTRARRATTAAQRLRATELDDGVKGVPLGETLTLGELGQRRWNVAAGDLSLPVLTLERDAVADNLAAMAAYCERAGVRLAPHGKTTMAPQLFAAQLRHGAWAMTAATPTQVAVMRRFGVSRIILANELTDPSALAWMARECTADPTAEFFCLADDPTAVAAMDATLAEAGATRALHVLVEVGRPGGRAGARTRERALAVAHAVHGARHLRLAGVEAFEGTVASDVSDAAFATIAKLCDEVRSVTAALAHAGLFETEEIIVTAGGSAYFDRIVASLSDWPEIDGEVVLVLRSGCYVSQDAGKYESQSPLAGRRAPGETLRLRNALTLWARVLSRPEPEVIVAGAGLRDAPVDIELPRPRGVVDRTGRMRVVSDRMNSYRVMDQHLFVAIAADDPIAPGDIISFDLSHPCTAFDKFRLIPVVDGAATVVDGILTFF